MIPTPHGILSRLLRRKINVLRVILIFQLLIYASATTWSGFVYPHESTNQNSVGSMWRRTDVKERYKNSVYGRGCLGPKKINGQKVSEISLSKSGRNQSSSGAVQEFGKRNEIQQQRSQYWVVVVDDEESIRNGVGQYLYQEGYQVTACSDAQSALNVCRSSNINNSGDQQTTPQTSSLPDAIVSDVRMPDIDGLEFLRILRSDPQFVAIPVILLTAKSMIDDRVEGYKAGADGYLPKPFDPEELLVIIDNIIARREALNGDNVEVDDLKSDLDEIKDLLLEKGGAGPGNGWVTENVFLTPAEKVVLEALCKGLMNKEIAAETYSSVRRVEQHLTSMYRKTKCSNRTELVRWAVSSGYVKI